MKKLQIIALTLAVSLAAPLTLAYRKKHKYEGDLTPASIHLRQEAGAGNLTGVKNALERGADINGDDSGRRTALWYAIDGLEGKKAHNAADKKRYQEVVDYLKAHGALITRP